MGRFVLKSNIDISKVRVLLRLPRRESHKTSLGVSCNETSSFLLLLRVPRRWRARHASQRRMATIRPTISASMRSRKRDAPRNPSEKGWATRNSPSR
jgi:hypothetical protein